MRSVEINHVVSFDLSDDKLKVTAEEECDQYYSQDFNKEEFQTLINELQSLCDDMA